MSADPFANYDAWLEAPYQRMIEESDHFYEWCEANDVDPDSPEAEDLYMADAEEYDEAWEEWEEEDFYED